MKDNDDVAAVSACGCSIGAHRVSELCPELASTPAAPPGAWMCSCGDAHPHSMRRCPAEQLT